MKTAISTRIAVAGVQEGKGSSWPLLACNSSSSGFTIKGFKVRRGETAHVDFSIFTPSFWATSNIQGSTPLQFVFSR